MRPKTISSMFGLTLMVSAISVATARADELLSGDGCLEMAGTIPLVVRKSEGDPFSAVAVYARTASLRKGQKVLVLSEMQAINDVRENVFIGSYIAASELPIPKESFQTGTEKNLRRISPMIGTNITPQQHYGVLSRHGTFQVEKDGEYNFALIVYSSTAHLNQDDSLRVQGKTCSLDILISD